MSVKKSTMEEPEEEESRFSSKAMEDFRLIDMAVGGDDNAFARLLAYINDGLPYDPEDGPQCGRCRGSECIEFIVYVVVASTASALSALRRLTNYALLNNMMILSTSSTR